MSLEKPPTSLFTLLSWAVPIATTFLTILVGVPVVLSDPSWGDFSIFGLLLIAAHGAGLGAVLGLVLATIAVVRRENHLWLAGVSGLLSAIVVAKTVSIIFSV